jgi:hypothetical protein
VLEECILASLSMRFLLSHVYAILSTFGYPIELFIS